MTRTEMIAFIKANPYVNITHEMFGPDEYIYSKPGGMVYTEEGYIFEAWLFDEHTGIRDRQGGLWEDGWSLYDSKLTMEKKIKLELTESEFNMILGQIKHMRCVVRDGLSHIADGRAYCNGHCNDGRCNKPELCNIERWFKSKIVDEFDPYDPALQEFWQKVGKFTGHIKANKNNVRSVKETSYEEI